MVESIDIDDNIFSLPPMLKGLCMDVRMYSYVMPRQMIQNCSQSTGNIQFIHTTSIWKQYSAYSKRSSAQIEIIFYQNLLKI